MALLTFRECYYDGVCGHIARAYLYLRDGRRVVIPYLSAYNKSK